jgi:hypothetical protein
VMADLGLAIKHLILKFGRPNRGERPERDRAGEYK